MIPADVLASFEQRLADLRRPVTIEYFQSGGSALVLPGRDAAPCRDCKPTLELLEAISGVSDRVELRVREFNQHLSRAAALAVDRVPGIVFQGEDGRRLALYGLPAGHFLSVVLGALLLLGRDPRPDPAIADTLARLKEPLSLRVLATVSHDASTTAAVTAYTLAAHYERVQALVYAMETFPELVQQLKMTHAPLTVINTGHGVVGATTPAGLAGYALELQQNPEAPRPPQIVPGTIGEVQRKPAKPSGRRGGSPLILPSTGAGSPPGSAPAAAAPAAAAPAAAIVPAAGGPRASIPTAQRPMSASEVSADVAQADVAIIGGGPAGLQAALVLSRARKAVVVFDEPSPPRNAASHGLHGYLGLEGLSLAEVRRVAWEQLHRYSRLAFDDEGPGFTATGATLSEERVVDVQRGPDDDFHLTTDQGTRLRARYVILAFGYRDVFPDLPGFAECWGKTIIPCVLCDGYEHRERAWGIVRADAGARATDPLMALNWTDDIQLIQGGDAQLDAGHLRRLQERGVRVHQGNIVGIAHEDGQIRAVTLDGGAALEIETLLWMPPSEPVPLVRRLVETLGLALNAAGNVAVGARQQTNVEHLWAAGDVQGWTGALASARQGETVAELLIQGWYR